MKYLSYDCVATSETTCAGELRRQISSLYDLQHLSRDCAKSRTVFKPRRRDRQFVQLKALKLLSSWRRYLAILLRT